MLRSLSGTLRRRLQNLRFGSANHGIPSEVSSYDDLMNYIRRKKLLLKAKMVSKNRITINLPKIIYNKPIALPQFTWSELAGHGSFLFLACSYLESDFLNLRLFAVGGITLSIIFQYYREIPLWIPIRWNALFLLINGVMIGIILKQTNDANNHAEEEKKLYKECFQHKGMNKIDFHHLISKANKLEARKGDKLVEENKKNTRVYLVDHGNLTVFKGDQKVGKIHAKQFVGAMSYLKWQSRKDDERRQVELVLAESQQHFQEESPVSWVKQIGDTLSQLSMQLFSGYQLDETSNDNYTLSDSQSIASSQSNNSHLSSEQLLIQQKQEDGHQGQADVICQDHCIVYYWKFRDLYQLVQQHPQLGLVIERSISEDLNRKMASTWDEELATRYKQLLHDSIRTGVVDEAQRQSLQKFRVIYHVSEAMHVRMLTEFGWTITDYERGLQVSRKTAEQSTEEISLRNYLEILSKHLSTTPTLDDETRVLLREYRQRNNVSGAMHVEALKRLGWTLDDYEIGHRESDDLRAIRMQQQRQQGSNHTWRGSILGSLSSWIFGYGSVKVSPQQSSANQEQHLPTSNST